MTDDAPIPPCGPERDHLVAEAVGWVFDGDTDTCWDEFHMRSPSSSDADALAALEAWRTVPDTIRSYVLSAPNIIEPEWRLSLDTDFDELTRARAPTLRDAATALKDWLRTAQQEHRAAEFKLEGAK